MQDRKSMDHCKEESIKHYIAEKVRIGDMDLILKIKDNFGISKDMAERYLRECVREGIISEGTAGSCGYELVVSEQIWEYQNERGLSEDRAYISDVRPSLQGVSKEAMTAWAYVFAEMMNNAIEHSQAKHIRVCLKRDFLYTEISIMDDGIGVFQNIRRYLAQKYQCEADNQDVFAELYKGKFTSDPTAHSGEGIFFSSKIMREFALWSENTIFAAGCGEKERLVESHLISYYTKCNHIGTLAVMRLENDAKIKTSEIFDRYTTVEEGLVKTLIPIKEVCAYGEPVARSQARRLLRRLEEFKEVTFDFADIEFLGQGFADEVFRVFRRDHPQVLLKTVHTTPAVQRMIVRARSA